MLQLNNLEVSTELQNLWLIDFVWSHNGENALLPLKYLQNLNFRDNYYRAELNSVCLTMENT